MQTYTIDKAAKILGIGRNNFYAQLKKHGWLRKDKLPHGRITQRGWATVKPCSYVHPIVGLKHYGKVHITAAGLEKLAELMKISIQRPEQQTH